MKANVYIITGFLGAGKTTLLKHILKSSADLSKTIVIVNEFGKVGIDGALVKSTATANIVELNQGCICCSLKADLVQTLDMLWQQYCPERIIIEATGVADPAAIIEALEDKRLLTNFRLDKTITVVDGDYWEAREAFGYVFKSQIRQADIIILNKIDILDKADIPLILRQIREESKECSIIPTVWCRIDPDIIWFGKNEEQKKDGPAKKEARLFSVYDPGMDVYSKLKENNTLCAQEAGFISFSFQTERTVDREKFIKFCNTLPLELFRIKGPVRFADKTRMLNFVGGTSHWEKWPDTDPTCLVFIGWNVVEELILEKLDKCIVESA